MSCLDSGAPPALDLLDEYWFFSNTLDKAGRRKPKPPLLPRSPPSTSTGKQQGGGGGTGRTARSSGTQRRLLLRTPSLPSPRPLLGMTMDDDDVVVDQQQQQQEDGAVEVDDDDLNWSSIYEGVLRTRIAKAQGTTTTKSTALHRAPSMPVHEASRPSMPRLTHSYTTLERQQQCRSHGTPTTTTKVRHFVIYYIRPPFLLFQPAVRTVHRLPMLTISAHSGL
uniref:Uncharacterized protein n=1 Tax=Arundo donax TaxID=35708 RepID=A0A0A9H336_ARUDO